MHMQDVPPAATKAGPLANEPAARGHAGEVAGNAAADPINLDQMHRQPKATSAVEENVDTRTGALLAGCQVPALYNKWTILPSISRFV